MHFQLEQNQTDLWHDVLQRRIEVAERLISKYQSQETREHLRLVALLRMDIARTRKKLWA